MVEIERLGFTLLHPRPEAPGKSQHTVNIVFVHGLRGHPRRTWEFAKQPKAPSRNASPGSEPTARKPPSLLSKFTSKLRPRASDSAATEKRPAGNNHHRRRAKTVHWPAEKLSESMPNARIWVYGYNADVVGGLFQAHNNNSVMQHGNDLRIKLERTLKDDAPVIFVAHSLGGLVVKAALLRMQSSLEERFRSFPSRVKAVVFCGTPHRGSNASEWGLLASNLIAVAWMDSNKRLLADLSVDSQVMDLIQEDFLKLLHQFPIRIHSFQEGRALTGVKGLEKKIVGDFSSKLGWPMESVETIDADHREMVRKSGVRDISNVLQGLEQEVLDQKRENVKDEDSHNQGPYTYLDRFFTIHYDEVLSKIPQRHPNTCGWLMGEDVAKNWILGVGSKIFWLHGYPGLGKSVFARFLVETLGQNNAFSSMTVYFFCSYRDDRASSVKSLVSSLIHQLLLEDPALSEPIKRKYAVIDASVTGLEEKL